MVKSILIPVDDSKMPNQALEYPVTKMDADEFTALHVLDPRQVHSPDGIESARVSREELLEIHRETAADILDDAEATAAEHGVEIETDLREGKISRTILDYVEEHNIDHVVVGSHGRTGVSRILLGSVAESVTRRSPVPVTVVR